MLYFIHIKSQKEQTNLLQLSKIRDRIVWTIVFLSFVYNIVIKYSRMSNLFNSLTSMTMKYILRPTYRYLTTPVGKITLFNSFLFLLWSTKGLTQSFLIDHFAFERENLHQNRFYTSITYAFSHLSYLHFGINMAFLQIFGNKIQTKYGSRYVWGLYLAGALAGSISMNYFMPYDTIPLPKVGADPCLSTFFAFLAVQYPKLALFNFIVPVRMWFLLLSAVFFATVSDSSCKNLGGLAMGATLGLLRKKFIL